MISLTYCKLTKDKELPVTACLLHSYIAMKEGCAPCLCSIIKKILLLNLSAFTAASKAVFFASLSTESKTKIT